MSGHCTRSRVENRLGVRVTPVPGHDYWAASFWFRTDSMAVASKDPTRTCGDCGEKIVVLFNLPECSCK